ISTFAAFVVTECGCRMLSGLYDFPVGHVRVRGVFTNTQPVDAYRGAGRPEAAYVIERIIDKAARELRLDPADFRRKNFIRADQMPFHTAFELDYDSGDFAAHMDKALTIADAAGLESRRAEAAARGKLLGFGLSTYIEACAGGPPEDAHVTVANTGKVTVIIGTQSNGQGHETAYKQFIAEALGSDFDNIEIIQGDSDVVITGKGTGGSRSIPVGGASIVEATNSILDKAILKAADEMEVATADLEIQNGQFTIAGTDRTMSFTELARKSGEEIAFQEVGTFAPPDNTYPNGTHAVELEVDPDTGTVEIKRFTVVDDFGKVMNPLLLEGQVHGGIAQGLGQALYENVTFEEDTGQLLSGSFMDYTMPRADHLPFVDFHTNNVPCATNPLGVKGAGEAGCIGSTPAIINAVIDALSAYGVEKIDMPATPQVIWQTIQSHQHATAAE
ncbi:MAG: molybdopterin cofactor-binding domain-containing protein, partial [Pseudomonadota bacterium]